MDPLDYIKKLRFYQKKLSLSEQERKDLVSDLDSRNGICQHLGFADVYGISGQAVILMSRIVDKDRYEVSFACTNEKLFKDVVGDAKDITQVFGDSLFPNS